MGKQSVFLKQFCVSAAFRDFSILHDINTVCSGDGRKPMGNHEHGLASGECGECLLYTDFVIGISKCGGLIQDQDRRVFQNCPGNGDPLMFTAGQVDAVRTDDRVNAVRKLIDDIHTLGGFQCLKYLLPGSIRPCHPDIFQNGGLDQPTVLKDKGYLIHQIFF